jgi:hypothetical protein
MNENHCSAGDSFNLDFHGCRLRACFFALLCMSDAVSSIEARRTLSVTCVNSSLSWTLFFSICWCIRNEVHFDSRMHAATKPTTSEGTMAKKAKKKAKSAVKKTAKKTRKVAKKKK